MLDKQHEKNVTLFSKGNYTAMNNYFDSINWVEIFKDKDVESNNNCLLAHYWNAQQEFIPTVTINTNKHPLWLNKEASKPVKLKKKLWHTNVTLKWKNIKLVAEYKKISKLVRKTLKTSIKQFEESLANDYLHTLTANKK
jgi:beta-glucosidase/6-phospho-beta-glucosidase/beta-galactosidase